jgi:hypothetical protein
LTKYDTLQLNLLPNPQFPTDVNAPKCARGQIVDAAATINIQAAALKTEIFGSNATPAQQTKLLIQMNNLIKGVPTCDMLCPVGTTYMPGANSCSSDINNQLDVVDEQYERVTVRKDPSGHTQKRCILHKQPRDTLQDDVVFATHLITNSGLSAQQQNSLVSDLFFTNVLLRMPLCSTMCGDGTYKANNTCVSKA